MAEFDSKKALAIDNRNRTMKDCLDRSFEQAKSIDMVVSFLMDSGIKTMREVLDDLKARKVKVRLLTSTYLNITSPTALYRIKKEYDDVFEIQIFNDSSISFHPKAYFFHYEDDDEVYVGSSNFSRSALESGVEWNVRLHRSEDQKAYSIFFEDFEYLWQERSIPLTEKLLKKYANEWKKIVRVGSEEQGETSTAIEPRGVQIEALYELNKTRPEGAKRGLVHAATGIGKTYLAAFDSVPFKKVLFVAHRKEILEQAKQAFENVRHCSTSFFNADEKCVFNLYGDVNQLIYDYKGIEDWEEISFIKSNSVWVLNENYRNTIQITEYCNDEFYSEIIPIGLEGPRIKSCTLTDGIDRLLSELNVEKEKRIAILCHSPQQFTILEKSFKDFNFLSKGKEQTGKIALLTVEQAKGLEFDSVLVYAKEMSENERYIAYTRSLNALQIAN